MKLNPLMLAPPVLFLGFAVFAAVGMFRDDPDALPSARQGKDVPPLSVTALGDKPELSLEALKTGGVKLVNFWASWCAPCRAEHPNLEALAKEGVPVFGINYKDNPEDALGFLAELGDPYTAIGADAQGRTGLDWGLYGVPETFIVDGDGVIVLRFAGPITGKVLEETIRPALTDAGLK